MITMTTTTMMYTMTCVTAYAIACVIVCAYLPACTHPNIIIIVIIIIIIIITTIIISSNIIVQYVCHKSEKVLCLCNKLIMIMGWTRQWDYTQSSRVALCIIKLIPNAGCCMVTDVVLRITWSTLFERPLCFYTSFDNVPARLPTIDRETAVLGLGWDITRQTLRRRRHRNFSNSPLRSLSA